MRRFVLAIVALVGLSSGAHAHVSAVPFPEVGSLQDVHKAAFGIFQTALVDAPAITTCNITTGACTGQGAGTGLFTAATCNGVADDRAAFNSFNTWARASTTNTNGQLLELFVPSGAQCRWLSGSVSFNFVMTGVKNGRISAYGATFQNPIGSGFYLASDEGICHKGLNDAAGCSARINTVSAGATSITITNLAFCSRFVTGRWAVVTGFDLQGGYNSPYGFPPNPHFLDYVQIGSTASCAGSGVIQINSPLAYSYLSTWPNFNSGNGNEADQGGPATIYALNANWDTQLDIRGLAIDSPNDQVITKGRSISIRDMSMTGAHCLIPSEAGSWAMVNSTGTNCNIEVDKIIGSMSYSGTTLDRLFFQSSSTNLLTWNGGSLTTDLNGTPKVATISNLTTPIIRLGPQAYGTPTSATCTNCVVTNQIASFGLLEKGGTGDPGANIFYNVSGGVFSYPLGVNVTNLTNNGSGKIRLTVGTSSGWNTGAASGISGGSSPLFSSCSAPSPCGADAVLSVINGTTIDITNYNFADVVWSGSGFLFNKAEQERWAVPGTNVTTAGVGAAQMPFFQVASVTQSGNFVNIATTLSGGFPTTPLTSGKAYLQVQAPKWTCTNCSGNAQVVDFSGAPPNIPIFSYSKRSYTNSTALVNSPVWGKVTSIKINVTTAYTGATNPMRFNPSTVTVIPAGTTSNWNVNINLRQAGLRTITPAGVTCDTGGGPVGGACSGDGTLTLPDPNAFFSSNLNLAKPDGSPTDQPWAMDYEFIMDQGVVP